MTDKVTLASVGSIDNSLITAVNNNNALLTTAIDNTLSRDGTSPNQMGSNLDMNNNQILNLPTPATVNSPARLIDVVTNPTITVPPTGTSGAVVGLLNGNNTVSGNNTYSGTSTFSNNVILNNVTINGTITTPIVSGTVQGIRIRLTAPLTLYVDVTNGNDSNTGLAPGVGNAFKTIQHAVLVASTYYDLNANVLTIQLADGTYNESVGLYPYFGRGYSGHTGGILIQGNVANPQNVVVNSSNFNAFTAVETGGFEWELTGMTFTAATGAGVYADIYSWIVLNNVIFGTCVNQIAAVGGVVEVTGNYTISGNGNTHFFASAVGKILFTGGQTVTVVGTPAFAASFMFCTDLSYANIPSSVTFTGAATGKRYEVDYNGMVNTGGSGANFFPGNSAGTTSFGGIYA